MFNTNRLLKIVSSFVMASQLFSCQGDMESSALTGSIEAKLVYLDSKYQPTNNCLKIESHAANQKPCNEKQEFSVFRQDPIGNINFYLYGFDKNEARVSTNPSEESGNYKQFKFENNGLFGYLTFTYKDNTGLDTFFCVAPFGANPGDTGYKVENNIWIKSYVNGVNKNELLKGCQPFAWHTVSNR